VFSACDTVEEIALAATIAAHEDVEVRRKLYGLALVAQEVGDRDFFDTHMRNFFVIKLNCIG
jgi:hypothetical protein